MRLTDRTPARKSRSIPRANYVYASNRGHDSVAVFAVNKKTGLLERRGHEATGGKTPRFFGLDPDGRWLLAANQGSDTVVVFRVDQKTGLPRPTGETISVSSPVCLVFASLTYFFLSMSLRLLLALSTAPAAALLAS